MPLPGRKVHQLPVAVLQFPPVGCVVTAGFDFSALEEEERKNKITIFDDDRFGCVKAIAKDGSSGWRCCHCNKFYGGANATKALAHIAGTSGFGIAACKRNRDFKKQALHRKLQSIRQSSKK